MLENILSLYPRLGRRLIKIFGFKFKKRNKAYIEFYQNAKLNNEEITSLRKNHGFVREIQLGNLALLKEFVSVCKDLGLSYWLDGGTMLGAVRHKGFIPWDDDIDVGMIRSEYEILIEKFNHYVKNKDIFFKFYRSKHLPCMFYGKICHKKLPFLFVDIFPFELYHKNLSKEEKLIKSEEIKSLRKEISKQKTLLKLSDKDLYSFIKKTIFEKVMEGKSLIEEDLPTIFWGIDFPHVWKTWFHDNKDFFPLKDIEYEGEMFKTIANPDAYLSSLYGNYMGYPSKLELAHCAKVIMSKKEKRILKEFIKG